LEDLILNTDHLTKTYNGVSVVDGVTLSIRRGDIYGLVGKNGAGKTTLMRMVAGLCPPSTGHFLLFGQGTAAGLRAARSRTGCMIEAPQFFPYLSASENLHYYCIQRGIPDKACIPEALKQVELDYTGNKKFRQFSLGMKQRLGLALAVLAKPDFLILDEPINGLDPEGIAKVRKLLLFLSREKQTTILISSHILSELSQIATQYGFLHNGKLLKEESAEQVWQNCQNRLVLKVNDVPRAAAVLEQQLGCREFEVGENNTIELTEQLDKTANINQTLLKNGVVVNEVYSAGKDVETYFLELIGGNADV
jgi:ABC-2 type transport system ATP-binding protein